jgi:hypothetical protein
MYNPIPNTTFFLTHVRICMMWLNLLREIIRDDVLDCKDEEQHCMMNVVSKHVIDSITISFVI